MNGLDHSQFDHSANPLVLASYYNHPASIAQGYPKEGACAELFPVYGTSRIVAGGLFKGSIFKCQLKPVAEAIAGGMYGVWTPTAAEQAVLEGIFPDGVCDFSLPDAGLPPDW